MDRARVVQAGSLKGAGEGGSLLSVFKEKLGSLCV